MQYYMKRVKIEKEVTKKRMSCINKDIKKNNGVRK